MRAGLWLAVSGLVAACNVVELKRDGMLDDLQGWGFAERTVQLEAATVRYWDGGDGPPVVLLHGFGASAVWQWHTQAEALLRCGRVVFPDLLWFGGSSSTVADYSLAHQVRTVVALLDRIGVERADLIGVSYGGLVAYELAASHPDRVGRLVMVDSPGPVFSADDRRALFERLGTEDLGAVLVPSSPDDVPRLLEIAYHDPPWAPGFVHRQAHAEMYARHRDEKRALLTEVLDLVGKPIRRAARALPSLVIWGRQDPFFPVELAARLAAFLGGDTRVHLLDEARHAPNIERADEFNAAVTRFLGCRRAPGADAVASRSERQGPPRGGSRERR